MKIQYLISFAALLAGCSSTATRSAALTSDQAGSLAQQLANAKAQTLYHCQPFHTAEPAQFIKNHWVWHQIQGQGKGDLEAKVEFKADGANPKVTLTPMVSVPRMPAGIR